MLFASAVQVWSRVAPNRVRLGLSPSPAMAERVANLMARETNCCSFFTFTMTAAHGTLDLEVEVPDAYVGVLEALVARVGRMDVQ